MVIKLYISGISGNKEVKKKQQRVQMILDSKQIDYEAIDITEPGKEKDKEFMQQNGKVRETLGKYPLPPQIFNDDDFCGDYEDFDMANEVDELEKFLHIETSSKDSDSDAKVNGLKERIINTNDFPGESEHNEEVEKSEVNGESEAPPSLEPSENITENVEISTEEVVPEKEESSGLENKTNDERSEKAGEENVEGNEEHDDDEGKAIEKEDETMDVENPIEETVESPFKENSPPPPLEEKDTDNGNEEKEEIENEKEENESDDELPQSEKSQE